MLSNAEILFVVGTLITSVWIVSLICFGVCCKVKCVQRRRNERANRALLNGLKPDIPSNFIVQEEFLGRGNFGLVYRGTAAFLPDATLGLTTVALKVLQMSNDDPTAKIKRQFLEEAAVQSTLDHRNVVKFLGVSSGVNGTDGLCVVIEYLEGGDLLKYLHHYTLQDISDSTIDHFKNICLQVAKGCEYLKQQKYVHRDIAARNCLLSSSARNLADVTVKIADFGMAKDLYRKHYYVCEETVLPWNWLAPESFPPCAKFSFKSDVCFNLMESCWGMKPRDRITFGELIDKLQPTECNAGIQTVTLGTTTSTSSIDEDNQSLRNQSILEPAYHCQAQNQQLYFQFKR